ncbi:MAG: hypothetical protein HY283_10700 [Nitrospirae bacterium]|nr:hypothetical protein [Nitrospirota bacterium]
MTEPFKISRLASLLLVLIFGMGLGLAGCGGGGGGSKTPSASATFTPDSASPGANTIGLSGNVSGGNLDLIVNANGVTDSIFGAAFDLTFDPAVLTYVSYTAGDFFEKSGNVTYAVAARSDRLIAGVSGQTSGVTGTGTVVTLHFQAKAAGNSATVFQNQALCSSSSVTSCDRQPSLTWFGGTYSNK